MKRTHLPGIARWPSAVTVAAAAALAAGLSLSSPAASAATAAPAKPSAAAPRTVSHGSSHDTVCGETTAGKLTDCKPLSRGQRAGANSARVSQTPPNLAAMVDTRTWTSGGGNTFPAPTCRSGWSSGAPTPRRTVVRAAATTTATRADRLQPDPRVRAGLRGRGDVPILPMTGALPSGDSAATLVELVIAGGVARPATTRPSPTCRTRSPRSSPRPRTVDGRVHVPVHDVG